VISCPEIWSASFTFCVFSAPYQKNRIMCVSCIVSEIQSGTGRKSRIFHTPSALTASLTVTRAEFRNENYNNGAGYQLVGMFDDFGSARWGAKNFRIAHIALACKRSRGNDATVASTIVNYNKKLSCRREVARRSVSLKILLSHSRPRKLFSRACVSCY